MHFHYVIGILNAFFAYERLSDLRCSFFVERVVSHAYRNIIFSLNRHVLTLVYEDWEEENGNLNSC